MKILLCSVHFRPSIGGIETVSEILADRFLHAHHEVLVVTQTSTAEPDTAAYPIVRRPSPAKLLKWVRWADIVLHNNISLRLAWPLLICPRPWVIAHHMWSPRVGAGSFEGRIKHLATRFATNIAVSEAMASSLSVPATVVPNPYADDLFVSGPTASKPRDLVFLGRLISSKGVSVLLEALARLRDRGDARTLTIVGGGPEEGKLREQIRSLSLDKQVCFSGFLQGLALVELLHQHRIMVVPSIAPEPFGIVAIEAIACGLVPVVSGTGGLPEAIGRCGLVVPPFDSIALADAISRLDDAELFAALLAEGSRHMVRHTRDSVAQAYLKVIKSARSKWS